MKKHALLLLLLVVITGCGKNNNITPSESTTTEQKLKQASFFEFGSFVPNSSRKILATVESKRDVKITANVNGTIEKIFVKIGDTVRSGAILARYKLSNDATQISYDNALVDLQSAKNSAQNAVKSAEINLQAAQREYEQLKVTQQQNIKQSYDNLDSQIIATDTSMKSFIDWSDRLLGVSDVGSFGEFANFSKIIGSNNSILKLNTKNRIKDVKLARDDLNQRKAAVFNLNQDKVQLLRFSQEQLEQLKILRSVANDIINLVRKTPVTARFSAQQKQSFEQQSVQYEAQVSGAYNQLKVRREAAIASEKNVNSALLSAQNRIKSAEANIELTKANSNAQVSQAGSRLRIAGKSKKDLLVRAPFTGKITDIFVSEFQTVGLGTPIIGILSEAENKTKITAQLSKEEYALFADTNETIEATLQNGTVLRLKKDEYADVINPITQKTKVILTPTESINVPIGSVLTLQLPLQKTDQSNLVPISAISFEPSGAEVLKILSDGTTTRQGVLVGAIKGNAVEISQGLEVGEKIIMYRNRVISGEVIKLPKVVPPETEKVEEVVAEPEAAENETNKKVDEQ